MVVPEVGKQYRNFTNGRWYLVDKVDAGTVTAVSTKSGKAYGVPLGRWPALFLPVPKPDEAAGTPNVQHIAKPKPALPPCEEWRTIVSAKVVGNRPHDKELASQMETTSPDAKPAENLWASWAANSLSLSAKPALMLLETEQKKALKQYQFVTREWPYCDAHMRPMEFRWMRPNYFSAEGQVHCAHGDKKCQP